ncbi:MAG: D-alanyl-D-alanine carboxypeptidase family protein [Ruminococcaceae bacterium]|nr:D-alanyl-D-alanine carboxypeptidase family protein [Oscillospiraceae bacterium]
MTSAYRSAAEQQALYEINLLKFTDSSVDDICAKPCYSEHQTGLVVDIQGSIPEAINIIKTPEAAWLRDN